MISTLLFIAFCGFLYWVALTLGVPQPWLKIIMVLLVLAAVVSVLNYFGVSTGLNLR